ncbi:hypothetical protein EWM64_g6848 [Hericium alpestre]|uniref:enoyl-[acyl-carrier-protein] reductase n=1 Tax=Hericium alpestre TaxID=135208 RepID=A0A4Y9ZSB2_9AGAM|nr:hypothetical protein EWM64_g6848 [Hericium alpestre]
MLMFRRVAAARRCFSTSAIANANRALYYSEHGPPPSVLRALTYPNLPAPSPGTLNLRVLLSPLNPSDINVIEGVYPLTPKPTAFPSVDHDVFIPGNEGLAEVTETGPSVSGLQKGDWVILTKPQGGTWNSALNVGAQDVVKIPRTEQLTPVHAATLTVNPPTAYNMLRDFVDLQPGDWVIQNGANSAVGQAVIQIARSRSLKTINLVRNRENIEELKKELTDLGADHVLTFDELAEKSTRAKDIRLGLNCVSGKPTALMARYLGQDAHLVSYGAMSKQPLSLPTSLFIFKNLTCQGFWQSRWYTSRSREEREKMVNELVELITSGKLKEPKHEVLTLPKGDSDAEVANKVRAVIAKMNEGKYGRKVLLRIEEPDD